jgi:superfamily II DNA or RNA helicase
VSALIEVGRNSIVVRDVDTKSTQFRNLNYNYSLYDKVQHKYTFSAFVQIDKDVYFPASISPEIIKGIFPEKDIILNYKNTAKGKSTSYNMKNQPRNDLQKKAIDFLMRIKDDYDNRERFLSLATGSGKTYVTINVISKLKKKAMIIVDTLELAAQWKREFLNHTDLKPEDVVILSGSETVKDEKKNPDGKVYVAIHRTLTNQLTEDYNSINQLMNKLGIGIRVFDEAHVNFKNVCMINSLSNVEYTLFLTATPGRSSFTDNHLYGKVFKRVPYFDGKEIFDRKYHTVILYPMDTKPSLDEKLSVKTKYGFNSPRWSKNVLDSGYEFLIGTLLEIFEKFELKKRGKKVAIMFPTIELIKRVKKDLESSGFEIGVFIGEIKKNEREAELKKELILTNDKIFDKGIDVKGLEVLINFVPFGSAIKTEQIMGRLRYIEGKQSVLIDVADYGYDECIKQLKLRKRFYKKNTKRIVEIEK